MAAERVPHPCISCSIGTHRTMSGSLCLADCDDYDLYLLSAREIIPSFLLKSEEEQLTAEV